MNWYKSTNIYVVYPDAFRDGKPGDFNTLCKNLSYISSMGFNAIHVLPFLKSPLLDGGFDVSDYFKVRSALGGNVGFDKFLKKAKDLNLKIFMDLVINHVSFKHDWFKKAVSGDAYYRNFFIHSTKKPRLLRVESDQRGRWAVYKLGRRSLRSRIIFYSDKKVLPHWVEPGDGYWYYHTFYPHQIDLNWTNLEVYKAFCKIIRFWGEKGLNFRIDAAPFAGKKLTGVLKEGSHKSHEIVGKLHKFAKSVNKDCVFLIEACQPTLRAKKYFGKGKSKESELAYNFTVMRSLWSALVSKSSYFIWEAIEATSNVPRHAQWVTFLRNHDELSLEYASPTQRELIYKSLLGGGIGFRGGFGIAGRTASFLEDDVKKILLAHFLLVSINGSPAIVYGDEIGKTTDKRRIKIDPRDSNRGSITLHDLEKTRALEIRSGITKILKARQKFYEIAFTKPQKFINHKKSVFSAKYKFSQGNLAVFANLGTKEKKIKLTNKLRPRVLLQVNGGGVSAGSVVLPSYSGIWIRL